MLTRVHRAWVTQCGKPCPCSRRSPEWLGECKSRPLCLAIECTIAYKTMCVCVCGMVCSCVWMNREKRNEILNKRRRSGIAIWQMSKQVVRRIGDNEREVDRVISTMKSRHYGLGKRANKWTAYLIQGDRAGGKEWLRYKSVLESGHGVTGFRLFSHRPPKTVHRVLLSQSHNITGYQQVERKKSRLGIYRS